MNGYQEPLKDQLEREAQELRVCSGFKVTIEQARNRVCEQCGWVSWAHMERCKAKRNAK